MIGMAITNPRLSFYLALGGAAIIGAVIGLLLVRVGLRRRTDRMIDKHTDNALAVRDAQLAAYLDEITELESQLAGYKVRFKAIMVFLGKAVETAGGVE